MPDSERGSRVKIPSTEPASSRMADISENLRAAQAYAAHYVAARIDQARAGLTKLLVVAVLGTLALLAGAALIITAVVLLCNGISGGVSQLLGNRHWLGDLATGLLVLAVLAVGTFVSVRRVTKSSHQAMVDSYARRKSQQRAEYGADVHERSAN